MSHSPNSGYISHTPMTAAIQSAEPTRFSDPESKPTKTDKEMEVTEKDSSSNRAASVDSGSMESTYDHTQRKLKPRHVQLMGIGGTIGTALYVQIGSGLRTSGPASLFIGFSLCPTSAHASAGSQSDTQEPNPVHDALTSCVYLIQVSQSYNVL
ncbi:unnamed protein product [Penicillium glandicola]